ncbi:exonuclease SbcCD subunit D [Radiobacillus sp. PE A8.2]|uniref:exonuclease SbcCD subunit D n=1 Tax=Radiobacillus sp. PE A8.2 TaxID=3380349 RepID=UPI0038906F69
MKIFHTADWHLGKLVQGVYMTEDQRYILEQFIEAIKSEQPDVVIIAGDLYDRAVPPTEAVNLLNEVLEKIVLDLEIPVVAVAGNHDSPGRLHFGSSILKKNGLHIVGQYTKDTLPVKLTDDAGDVYFHLVPYADPSMIRHAFDDETIQNHHDAMRKIVENIENNFSMDNRHVFVGHAFVTPFGEQEENTSDSERPLSIGGAEHVDARLFTNFNYTALGHLHQAHYVMQENIQYAGSPLKYSISEENHKKGYLIVELDTEGHTHVEKRLLSPKRDMLTVETTINDLLQHETDEDYVFVRLLDETPVLSPMEKVRSVYPNAMHVERKVQISSSGNVLEKHNIERHKMDDFSLFKAFYKEVKGSEVTEDTSNLFKQVLDELLLEDDRVQTTKQTTSK